jgi:acetylcholinesterase
VRAAPATKIRSIIDKQMLAFNPTPDNVTLVSDPAERRLAGNIAPIPVLGGTDAQEGRVFTVGQNDTTAYLETLVGDQPDLIKEIEAAYPIGQDGIETPYDQCAQIFTEFFFQCPQALWANATASVGIPAWRYYFNASFYNTQGFPAAGVYHSSEIEIVFSTFTPINTTTQEYALSSSMRGIWAKFAKNPMGGPGWNGVGTGAAGPVLTGAIDVVEGGLYMDASGDVLTGAWDLGLFGNRYDAMGSGVTVIDQFDVDYRCGLFTALYG